MSKDSKTKADTLEMRAGTKDKKDGTATKPKSGINYGQLTADALNRAFPARQKKSDREDPFRD